MPFPKGHKFGNRFKPGQSGNPSGRPRTKVITDALRELAAQTDPKTRKQIALRLAEKLIERALKGELPYIREVTDRLEGRPVQPLDHGGELVLGIRFGGNSGRSG